MRILGFRHRNASTYNGIGRNDMGDIWEHTIQIEKALPAEAGVIPRCIDGKRACPPEDCGGPWG